MMDRAWSPACVLICLAAWGTLPGSEGPLAFEKRFVHTGRSIHPLLSDYDRDGVQDLLAASGGTAVQILSGRDAHVIRTCTDDPAGENTFGAGLESMADSDGDGLRDFMIGDPFHGPDRHGVAYGVQSSSPPGPVVPSDLLFRLEGDSTAGALGWYLGATDRLALVSWEDAGRAIVLDALTGEVLARLGAPGGDDPGVLGQSLAGIGDITGDGVEDFAIGGGNVRHDSGSFGSVFIFDGKTRTPGLGFQDVSSLPSGMLIGELFTETSLYIGGHGGAGDHELIVNLGDPLPTNGEREALIATGTPAAEYYGGGLAVHLLRESPTGGFTVEELAAYVASEPDGMFGLDLADLEDVDGDGVHDLAIFSGEYGEDPSRPSGRILVVSGERLLDGLQLDTDVLQEVRGTPDDMMYGVMRAVGDYDGDGRRELLITMLYNPTGSADLAIYEIVPVTSPPGFHRGDATADGSMDISDAASILGYTLLGSAPPSCRDAADANDDARIDIADAIYVLSFLFRGGPVPPAPGAPPAPCGTDGGPPGSAGDLGCEAYAGCE